MSFYYQLLEWKLVRLYAIQNAPKLQFLYKLCNIEA